MGIARSRTQSLVMVGGALAALYATLFAIVGSAMFRRAPQTIGFAVTLDLTLTATFLVWWLGVRRRAVSPWVAVATLSWGVAAARRWVPHAPIGALLAAGGALEVVTVGWLLIRATRVRSARSRPGCGPGGCRRGSRRSSRPSSRWSAWW